jgi:hypothetical protein
MGVIPPGRRALIVVLPAAVVPLTPFAATAIPLTEFFEEQAVCMV